MDAFLSAWNPFQISGTTRVAIVLFGAGALIFSVGHFMMGTASIIEARKDLDDSSEVENSDAEESIEDTEDSIAKMKIDMTGLDDAVAMTSEVMTSEQ